MLDDWRIERDWEGGMSSELFLALAWYGSRGSPFAMISDTDIDSTGLAEM